MQCPFCHSHDTYVKDSRDSEEGTVIRRRRHCSKCKSKFTTLERVQLKELFVLKRSGLKKPFDRQKIVDSIKTAVRKRRITESQIDAIVDEITRKLNNTGIKEISTRKIGEMIMMALADIDEVAYIRFASVYKDFMSAKDFANFISQIRTSPGAKP